MREIERYSLSILFLFEKLIKILRIYKKIRFIRILTRYNLNRYLYKDYISRSAK